MMSTNVDVKPYARQVTSAERFFSKSPYSIVTLVARINGYVSEEMLKNAVTKVQQRHALLRVRIREDSDHVQWFTSEGIRDIPVEVIARTSRTDWVRVHAEVSRIPFDFETCPAIRFVLVQSPDVSDLIILCHHTICDGMSLAFLARDVMVYLGNPDREVDRLPPPPAIGLDNLPDDISQSGLVNLLINRMNRQWAEERVFFDDEDYRTITRAYWDNFTHELFVVELSEEETSALVARCRHKNVTVNTALTVAFAGAQGFVEGSKPYQSKVVVAADLRDRLPNPAGEGMGMYAGGVELTYKYNHSRSFWQNARKFHRRIQPKLTNRNLFSDILNWLYLDPTIFEAFHFKKLGSLVSPGSAQYDKLAAFSEKKDVVWRLLQRDNLESLETKHWGTAVTNLGRLDFPQAYGALELERLIMQPGGGIPLANVNMVLGAVTCSGKLSLVVEYAPEAVNADTMARIKDKAVDFLLHE